MEVPNIDQTAVSRRIDELFSREVLGAILIGTAVGKVVEKMNTLMVILIILFGFNITVEVNVWMIAAILLIFWTVESVGFMYLYVKWEQYMQNIEEAAEKAAEAKDKTKDKVSREDDEVKTYV